MATDKEITVDGLTLDDILFSDKLGVEEAGDAYIEYMKRAGVVDMKRTVRLQEMESLSHHARAAFAPENYASFFKLIVGLDIPPHAQDWIPRLFKAREEGKRGVILRVFRGGIKSTQVAMFNLFRLGHRPYGSQLIIRLIDDVAYRMTNRMARVIKNSLGWKMAFPHVVPHPDTEAPWGRKVGYEVIATKWWWEVESRNGKLHPLRMLEYDEPFDANVHELMPISPEEWNAWREREQGEENPSFLGGGITSDEIVGKHPTNCVTIDDIHNRDNTESERKMQAVKDRVSADLVPTWEPSAWLLWACTPWKKDDAYGVREKSGNYEVITVPVFDPVDAKEEDREAGVFEYRDYGMVKSAWPEKWTEDYLDMQRKETAAESELDFERMYLVSLAALEGRYLKLENLVEFEVEKIPDNARTYIGVDFTYTSRPRQRKRYDVDKFALAVGKYVPFYGMVLVDGYSGELSQAEAENKVKEKIDKYRGSMRAGSVGIEAIREGKMFANILLQDPGYKKFIKPLKSYHAKEHRFLGGLEPAFEEERAYIGDNWRENAFLTRFRDRYGLWQPGDEHGDDELDAVYFLLFAARRHIIKGTTDLFDSQQGGKSPFSIDRRENAPQDLFPWEGRRKRTGLIR